GRRAADPAHAGRRGAGGLPPARDRHRVLAVGPRRAGGDRARARPRLAADPLAAPGVRHLRGRLQARAGVTRTRVLAYPLGAFCAAMGGPAATATTGIGPPYAGNFITLNSVAAV